MPATSFEATTTTTRQQPVLAEIPEDYLDKSYAGGGTKPSR